MSFLLLGLRILAAPLLIVYFGFRAIRDPRYFPTLGERLGWLPASFQRTPREVIWLHAVSVGEAIASVPFLEELRRRDPSVAPFVSAGTLSGRAVAGEKLAGLAEGVFYCPIDYAFAVRRVLRAIRPAAVVVMETEIWPVLYREAARAGCALVVVNGRISAPAMERYKRFRFLFRHALSFPDAILAQSGGDRERYLALGAPPERVTVAGNLKYDSVARLDDPPAAVQAFLDRVRPREIWIAASTMPGVDSGDIDEDDAAIAAFREIAGRRGGLLLILVPRKPERFDTVAERLGAAGVSYARRSRLDEASPFPLPGVLLLDSMGEMASLFPLAGVVFMGGTLAKRGGHNILEPAGFGKPVIAGPHLENFPEIADDFRAAGAMVEIENADDLAPAVERLLASRELREELGARGAALAGARRGAAARAAQAVLEARDRALPLWREGGLAAGPLWVLARLWSAGSRLKRRRDWLVARSLGKPVISVGGIGMGGAGKTPFTAMLAQCLAARGHRPAILTRGYRRRSIERAIVAEAGTEVPPCMTGDEAQILIRFAHAHVGIGADRWATGRLIEERLDVDVFLLDDGFQHWRLRRDLDIVLIDALDPFGGASVFPLGRLREPRGSLRRAGCFVIARARPGRKYEGIRRYLRRFNAHAPVFLSRVYARSWINERTRRAESLPEGPVVAFCGLANPATFWKTLDGLGYDPVFRWAFDDHHAYLPRELGRLAAQARDAGAVALLTTEKDAMNLPAQALEAIAPFDLYWLRIEVGVDEEEALLRLVEEKMKAPGAPPAGR